MLRRTLLPLALAGALLVPATAGARTFTASSHGLSATLVGPTNPTHPQFPVLTVQNPAGTTLYHGQVTNRACGTGCGPSITPQTPALRFAALQGPGTASTPDLLVNLYSGGANCCFVTDVLAPSAAVGGQYTLSTEHNFGSAGYRLRRLDGRLVFETADNRFETAFTDFASSGLPLLLQRLEGTRFADVTSDYPRLVRRDAARWLKAYHRAHGRDNVGFAAAWAADEARLGYWSYAHAYLVSQARAGYLHSALLPHLGGLRFVDRLETFLRRGGYFKKR